MVSKRPWGKGTETPRNLGEKKRGTTSGFAKGGRSKPAQFSANSPGQKEKGFKQWTEKTATAAMQGGPMPGGKGEADKGPRRDAKRQFSNAPGRKVF